MTEEYFKHTPPLEFIRDLRDIMRGGDNLTPERLNADILGLVESYLEAIERGDRLEAMVDRVSENLSNCVLLINPMYDLCQQIEVCGASVELTKAVTMASDIMHKLMDATGAQQLPPKRKQNEHLVMATDLCQQVETNGLE
jgi:hypothetical protein